METCEPCPTTWGIKCDRGKLQPQQGFWSPCVLTPEHTDCTKFDVDTKLLKCLSTKSCNVTARSSNDTLTPATAFNCTQGHEGALCAACSEEFYFRGKRCRPCEEELLPHNAIAAIASLLSLGTLFALFKLAMRKYSVEIMRALHRVRRALSPILGLTRDARRRRRRMQRFERRLVNKKRRGRVGAHARACHERDQRAEAAYLLHVERHGTPAGFRTQIRATAVKLVHSTVRAAKEKLFGASETVRIVLNIFKVLSHLYSGLARCTWWPTAIENFVAVAAIFTLDIFSETKVPCAFPTFSYYDRVLIACFAPIALVLLIILGGLIWASRQRKGRSRQTIMVSPSMLKHERLRGASNSTFKMGLWKAATPALFLLDLPVDILQNTISDRARCALHSYGPDPHS